MSKANTHMERSHRSKRGYSPVCKTMKNKERKKRQAVNHMIGKMFPNAANELDGRKKREKIEQD